MTRTQTAVAALTLAATASCPIVACGGAHSDRCTPGQQRICICPTGEDGAQTCGANGLWQGCTCGAVVGTGGAPAGGAPAGGSSGLPMAGSGGTTDPTAGAGGGTETVQGNSGIIPDDGGAFITDWDVSGVVGPWYIYGDDAGSSMTPAYADPSGNSPFGSDNGEMCFSGTAVGHGDVDYETHWGVGVGFNVCTFPDDITWLPAELQAAGSPEQVFQAADCPTGLSAVSSVTFTITGTWTELRLNFKESDAQDVAPFYKVVASGTYTVTPSGAMVPDDWDVPNAGEVGSSNVQAIQFQLSSQTSSTSFSFCLRDITIN